MVCKRHCTLRASHYTPNSKYYTVLHLVKIICSCYSKNPLEQSLTHNFHELTSFGQRDNVFVMRQWHIFLTKGPIQDYSDNILPVPSKTIMKMLIYIYILVLILWLSFPTTFIRFFKSAFNSAFIGSVNKPHN